MSLDPRKNSKFESRGDNMELLSLNHDGTLNIFDKKPEEIIELYAIFINENIYRYKLIKHRGLWGFNWLGNTDFIDSILRKPTIQESCHAALKCSDSNWNFGHLKTFVIKYRNESEYIEYGERLRPIFEESILYRGE